MAGNGATDDLEYDLTKQSVGYLSKEDYKRKREELEHEKALNALKRMAGAPAPALPTMADAGSEGADGGGSGSGGGAAADDSGSVPPSDAKKKKSKKDKKKGGAALSFGDELEEEADAVSPGGAQIGGLSAFRAREAAQAAERQEAAMREVLMQQQKAKAEPVTLQYTFRSAVTQRELTSGVHKGSVTVKRGFTADEVAAAVRNDVEALGGKFAPNSVQGIREERDCLLVLCCEGQPTGSFIAPGAVSLVELQMRKWSDQPSIALFDDFKHGIVVTERRWYDSQRHTYPYHLWRQYESRFEYNRAEFIANRAAVANPFDPQRESKAKR